MTMKALCLLLFAGAASAQTYDLDLNMGAYQFSGEVGPVVNVAGSGYDFTAGGAGYLIDLEGAPTLQAAGSYVFTLQYYLTGTQITGALLQTDGQMGYSCGTIPGYTPPPMTAEGGACVGSVVDPPAMKAPELDVGRTAGALTLLCCGVLILKGRRA
jgi:hypothetical protein